MTIPDFVARWKAATVSERAGYQEHFRDLCALVGHPTPMEADHTGESYAFEKGVKKTTNTSGRVDGFADVWKRGFFAFEYKGKKKNLNEAYQQLLTYREDLENPPLLVVCDLARFEIHTNFTGTVKRVFAFDLAELETNQPTPTCPIAPLSVLRALFTDPDALRPAQTMAGVTKDAAETFGLLARSLTLRGYDPHPVAHFLIRLLFCLFAEDVGLLPTGLFTKLVSNFQKEPEAFSQALGGLFAAMAKGGIFGFERIKYFNGGLFDDEATLPLIESELVTLAKAAALDWGSVEPSIFGTLFERSLDPTKRSQLGAHYTSREDIALIVGPVVVTPLTRRWEEVKGEAEKLLARRREVEERQQPGIPLSAGDRRVLGNIEGGLTTLLQGFSEELAGVRVLDPACGSGNFLYVSLRSLLDLEKQLITYATGVCGLTGFFPRVGPEQMRGLELNEYAVELAPVVVWIGYIQWLRENGFGQPEEPILRRFDMIQQQDAILTPEGTEPAWPEADYIVGNPPFLGDKKMRAELGDEYTERLRKCYSGRLDGQADLVTYWFEKSHALIEAGQVKRAGLICTNGIRYGANRKVLERIKQTGDLFMAWADRPWALDGAEVRVSLVAFDDGQEIDKSLDGKPVSNINADLTAQSADVTVAEQLPENKGIVFLGPQKNGPFDLDDNSALQMLKTGGNPNGRPNSDVVRPTLGGQDITGRDRKRWIIDFGAEMSEEEASLYEIPFEYVRAHVKPLRDLNRRESRKNKWWLFGETVPALRQALSPISRCIVTPEVSKHRLFVWMPTTTVPDKKLHIFARDDDYFFGVLHSRIHEVWSLALGNRMGVGNDPVYSSSKTFGTFPMPWPPGNEPNEANSPTVKAIADAARRLVELRDNWLNPEGVTEAELKKRTLTNLYNQRSTWLDNAHRKLDEAVVAAYSETTGEPWAWPMEDGTILEKLLALNRKRSGDSG